MFPSFRKSIAFCEVPRLLPFVVVTRAAPLCTWVWALVEWYWQGKRGVLGEKNLSQCRFCPPQISHGQTWDRIRASAVRGRWLTGHKREKLPEMHLNVKSVPRSKHSPSRLYKPISVLCIIAVSSQIHTKYTSMLFGQNVEFVDVKLVVHIVTTGL
jgi:hypothetical protein